MKQTRITDKITYVEPDSMARFHSCAGIIVNSSRKIFIDMNLGPEDSKALLKKEQPHAALITHCHLDHSIWTQFVKKDSMTRVFIPECEADYLTDLDFVVEKTAGPFGRSLEWKNFVVNKLGYKPLETYETYNSKATEFPPEMVLVKTPGHSPGHTSFYFPLEKILFSGDMGLDRFGPWYGWQDCDIKKIIESILRLASLDVKMILTSHGGIIQGDIHQAWSNSMDHILKRETRIRQQLDKGLDPEKIIEEGVFFSRKKSVAPPMRSFLDMWDTAMFAHHLNLINQGGILSYFPELKKFSRS